MDWHAENDIISLYYHILQFATIFIGVNYVGGVKLILLHAHVNYLVNY